MTLSFSPLYPVVTSLNLQISTFVSKKLDELSKSSRLFLTFIEDYVSCLTWVNEFSINYTLSQDFLVDDIHENIDPFLKGVMQVATSIFVLSYLRYFGQVFSSVYFFSLELEALFFYSPIDMYSIACTCSKMGLYFFQAIFLLYSCVYVDLIMSMFRVSTDLLLCFEEETSEDCCNLTEIIQELFCKVKGSPTNLEKTLDFLKKSKQEIFKLDAIFGICKLIHFCH